MDDGCSVCSGEGDSFDLDVTTGFSEAGEEVDGRDDGVAGFVDVEFSSCDFFWRDVCWVGGGLEVGFTIPSFFAVFCLFWGVLLEDGDAVWGAAFHE